MEQIKILAAAAVLAALSAALSPATPRIRRSVGFVSALLIMTVLFDLGGLLSSLDPLFSFDKSLPTVQTPAMLEVTMKQAIEEGLAKDLTTRFDLDTGAMSLTTSIEQTEDGWQIKRLVIKQSSQNIFADHLGMVHYIEKAYGAEAEVTFCE